MREGELLDAQPGSRGEPLVHGAGRALDGVVVVDDDHPAGDDPRRTAPELDAIIPDNPNKAYDMKAVIRAIPPPLKILLRWIKLEMH